MENKFTKEVKKHIYLTEDDIKKYLKYLMESKENMRFLIKMF